MIIKNIENVPAEAVQMEGAKDVKVRVIFGPKDKAPTFAMRLFEVGPGGHTPFHQHNFEHEVVVLAGEVAVVREDGAVPLKVHDALLVAANEVHQFRNLSSSMPARFLCLVPIAYQK
ncbi:MAG TPA: cupin domain-containing protein [Anaerohalosphaeraceae bacterium]|nr:cupin domain-containing protein [Anaerohalosphaeraceae bacterium]